MQIGRRSGLGRDVCQVKHPNRPPRALLIIAQSIGGTILVKRHIFA